MGIAGSIITSTTTKAAVGFYTMYNVFYIVGVGSNVYTIAGEVPTPRSFAPRLSLPPFQCPQLLIPCGHLSPRIRSTQDMGI
jgi:hypothetical protein